MNRGQASGVRRQPSLLARSLVNKTRENIVPLLGKTLQALALQLKLKNKRVDVLLVGKIRMRRFNKQFRAKDYATDVLSFGDAAEPLGDLIICPAVVRENACRYGNSYASELVFVLLHGVLHLLGYNHIKRLERLRMERRERQLLRRLGYREPR